MNGGEHKHLQVLKVLSKSDSWAHIQTQDIYITPFLQGNIGKREQKNVAAGRYKERRNDIS